MAPDDAPPRPDEKPQDEDAQDTGQREKDPRHSQGSAQKKAPADRPQPQATGHPENAG